MPENLKWNTHADPKKTYLAAVSGGPDSMALLDQLVKRGYKVAAVHINYHIPDVSNLGENRTRKYCRLHKIRVHLCHVRHNGEGNFEAWARDFRYAYFKKLAEKYHYAGIFMGHQEDDLIETYFMQKEKGSAFSYWGIREEGKVRGLLVYRPLLDNTKKELLDYVIEQKIPYYLDYTNDTRIHRRNEIRQDTVKTMTKEERAKIRKEICAQNRELSKKIEELRRCAECLDPFDPKAYGAMNPKVRAGMIRQYLIDEGVEEAYHFSDARLTEIDRQLSLGTNRRILLSKTTVWDLDYGKLCLHEPAVAYEITRKNRHAAENPYFFTSSEGESVEGVYLTKGDFPVKIRSPKEGDEIRLSYGTKKLSRFFIDRKIPRYARETWPVLENKDGKIVLVPGIGCDVDHYKLPYNWYLRRKSGKNLTNP